MSEHERPREHDPRFTPEQERIRRAVASLTVPRPRPEFREQARARFTGPMDPPTTIRKGRTPALLWAGFGVAAALAVIFVALATVPSWKLAEGDPGTTLRLNGKPVALADLIQNPLPASSRIENLGPGDLRLQVDGALSVVLAPGSEARFGVRRRLLKSPVLTCEVDAGQILGTTGSAFPSGGLDIRTTETDVHVSGTTFGIIKGPENTCICVFEGTVLLERGANGESAMAIPAGRRYTVQAGVGSADAILPLTPGQTEKLSMICTLGVPGDSRN